MGQNRMGFPFIKFLNKAIAGLSRALLSSVSIREIADLVLDQAKDLTSSSHAYVGHLDPFTSKLSSLSTREDLSSSSSPSIEELDLPPVESLTAE